MRMYLLLVFPLLANLLPIDTLSVDFDDNVLPCSELYETYYCLNEAKCFAVSIGGSIEYGCECKNGNTGHRCEFKEPFVRTFERSHRRGYNRRPDSNKTDKRYWFPLIPKTSSGANVTAKI